jgi:hypothetical protein
VRRLRLFSPKAEVHTGADAVLDETSTQEDVRARAQLRAARAAAPHAAWRARSIDRLSRNTHARSCAQVYAQVADVVQGALEGVNGTIFAYGQTGTGKTYTMLGATSRAARASPQKALMHGKRRGRMRTLSRLARLPETRMRACVALCAVSQVASRRPRLQAGRRATP